MIIEPSIKSNFERGFANSDVKTFENGTELKALIQEKEKLEKENKKLKTEIEQLKSQKQTNTQEKKSKKGGE